MESGVSQISLANASAVTPSSNPTCVSHDVTTNLPEVPVLYPVEALNLDSGVNPKSPIEKPAALVVTDSMTSPQNAPDIPFPVMNRASEESEGNKGAKLDPMRAQILKSEPHTIETTLFDPLVSWLKQHQKELQTQLVTIGNTTHLQISPLSLESSQLQLLPPFYLKAFAASSSLPHDCGDGGFDLILITFHGRVLKSQSLISSPPYISDLLINLNSYNVCSGYRESGSDFQVSDILAEYVGGHIVVRNRQCSYVVQGKKRCEFCVPKKRARKRGQPKTDTGTRATELNTTDYVKFDPSIYSDSEDFAEETDDQGLPEADSDLEAEVPFVLDDSEPSEEEIKIESDESDVPLKRKRKGRLPPKPRSIKRQQQLPERRGGSGRPGKRKKEGKEKDKGGGTEVEHRCGKCGKLYKSIYPYYKHVKKCAEGGADAAAAGGGSLAAEGRVIEEKCKLCLRHFNRQWQLNRHYKLHEQRFQLDEKVSGPTCRAKFSKLELNTHFQATHDPDNGCCTECFQVIPEEKLCRHLEIAHFYNLGNKLCPLCGEKFNYPHQLKTHMEMVHEKEDTSVVCDYCGKLYAHKFKLKKHINMIHFDNKGPQTCKTCGKVFATTAGLYKHVKVHSVVKPFQCGLCTFRSLRPGNVKAHVKSVHKLDSPQDHVVKVAEYAYNDGLPMQKQGGPAEQET